MNEKGSVSTEILVVLIVILLIIGITAKFSEITLDKLATSTENENIEVYRLKYEDIQLKYI